MSSNDLTIDRNCLSTHVERRGCSKSGTASSLASEIAMNVQTPPRSGGKGNGAGGRRRRRARPRAARSIRPALDEVRALLTDRPRRRDLLIEHLHLIQDHYGHLSAAHLAALAAEMKMAQTEVYEVATFYSHFDVVKDGAAAAGDHRARLRFAVLRHGRRRGAAARSCRASSARTCAWCARPAWAPATARRSAPSAMCRRSRRRRTRSRPR